jgi:hypothetical protein
VVSSVKSVVVDVTEHGTGSNEGRSVTVQVDSESVNKVVGALRGRDVGDLGRFATEGRDGALLENVNNSRRLEATAIILLAACSIRLDNPLGSPLSKHVPIAS